MKITDTIGSLLKSRPRNRILSIAPDQSVYEALQLMAQYDVGALLVLSHDELVGIFSERDYARKVILRGRASRVALLSFSVGMYVATTAVNVVLGFVAISLTLRTVRFRRFLEAHRPAPAASEARRKL